MNKEFLKSSYMHGTLTIEEPIYRRGRMTREEMYGDLFLVRTGSIHPTSKKFVRMTVEILNVIDEYDALKRKVLKSSKNQK